MDLEKLKRNLRTDIALTLSGEGATGAGDGRIEPSALLLMKPRELPRALITDSRGVTTPKVLDYVDLISTLDSSSVVTELEREPVRTLALPELPDGALLVDLIERPSGNSYVLTGTIQPQAHLFVLDEGDATSTHELNLPRICYRAHWDGRQRNVITLALALCSPALKGEPTAATELYRWPFSNVYHDFGGTLEGVCWPSKKEIELNLAEMPDKMLATL